MSFFYAKSRTCSFIVILLFILDILNRRVSGRFFLSIYNMLNNFKNEKFTFNNEEFYGAKFTVILNKD